MRRRKQRVHQPKTKRSEDHEVYCSVEKVLEQLHTAIPAQGGCYTIDALAQKLEGFYPGLSTVAKRNLVRRALEWSVPMRAGKAVPMFIGIWTVSGKLTTRRPSGGSPVGDSVIFEPLGL